VGRTTLFHKPGDYAAFEAVLRQAKDWQPMRLLAYCLMPNHWHLLLWPHGDGELSEFLRWLTLTHTQRWHAHHHSAGSGPIYQGRFKSFPVQEDEHLLRVCRYVERNGLRAGLAERAEGWALVEPVATAAGAVGGVAGRGAALGERGANGGGGGGVTAFGGAWQPVWGSGVGGGTQQGAAEAAGTAEASEPGAARPEAPGREPPGVRRWPAQAASPYGRRGLVLPNGSWWEILQMPPERLPQQLSALNPAA
jgi:REP element-mobilizing transposase RayT